jgi:hypothetical protein
MTITLQGLLHADTATVRSVAERWERLVAAIDTAVEDLGRTTQDLPNHWSSGPGALAAQGRRADLRVEVGNAHRYCDAIGHAVRGFADDLEHYRQMLHGVVSEARGRGFTIDLASGLITAPIESPGGADAYVAQIGEILAKANAANDRAAAILDDNVAGEVELASTRPPDYLQVDPYALSIAAPPDLASWWHGLHPLVRERYVAAYPEVLGAAEGLPSRDRDAANRILLLRKRDELLAARQRLDAVQDGAGSRALAAVDTHLAAVDSLQRRLDDPARPESYLVDYQPGDEQHAEPSAGDARWDAVWVD